MGHLYSFERKSLRKIFIFLFLSPSEYMWSLVEVNTWLKIESVNTYICIIWWRRTAKWVWRELNIDFISFLYYRKNQWSVVSRLRDMLKTISHIEKNNVQTNIFINQTMKWHVKHGTLWRTELISETVNIVHTNTPVAIRVLKFSECLLRKRRKQQPGWQFTTSGKWRCAAIS